MQIGKGKSSSKRAGYLWGETSRVSNTNGSDSRLDKNRQGQVRQLLQLKRCNISPAQNVVHRRIFQKAVKLRYNRKQDQMWVVLKHRARKHGDQRQMVTSRVLQSDCYKGEIHKNMQKMQSTKKFSRSIVFFLSFFFSAFKIKNGFAIGLLNTAFRDFTSTISTRPFSPKKTSTMRPRSCWERGKALLTDRTTMSFWALRCCWNHFCWWFKLARNSQSQRRQIDRPCIAHQPSGDERNKPCDQINQVAQSC